LSAKVLNYAECSGGLTENRDCPKIYKDVPTQIAVFAKMLQFVVKLVKRFFKVLTLASYP